MSRIIKMEKHKCTLRSVYKSMDMQMIVIEKLTEVFNFKFEKIIKESKIPYIACPARYFEPQIRHMFIEEGVDFDTAEDLENILIELNYLKFDRFRKNKESHGSDS